MSPFTLVERSMGPGPYPDVSKIPTPPLQAFAVAVMFILPAIALIIYSLRIYARVSMRTLGLDDLLAGLALIMAILVSSTLFMFLKLNYYGWEDSKVPEDLDPSAGLWWNFFEQLCYNPVLALVKASVLVFLLRLGGHDRTIYRVIWTLMFVNAGHAIAVLFGALFQCLPIETNWTPELRGDPDTVCIDNSFHIIQSSFTILTDVLILALPFWIFLGLRMPKSNKVAVLGIFAIGSLVPIVAIVRLVNIYDLIYNGKKASHNQISYVWTAVEVNLAVICCCMPALRPLLSRWLPNLFPDFSGRSSGNTGNGDTLATIGGTNSATARGRGTHNHDGGHSSNHHMLKDLHPYRKKQQQHTEIRGTSPTGSEEEIMTYNGILRTTNFDVKYEDAKRSDRGSKTSSDMPREQSPGNHV